MSIFKRFKESEIEILYLPQVSSFKGEVEIIGSKSIANRVIYLASFCSEETILQNVPNSEDVQVLLSILPDLGIECVKENEKTYKIKGKSKFDLKNHYFNLENAGTALRPLVAILSTQNFHQDIIIDGNEQMRNRPIRDLVEALKQIGVDIETSYKGTPPVKIKSGRWKKNRISISGKTSSQFISALLLAAPLTEQEIEIFVVDEVVSKPYIDMTIHLMKEFSVNVINENYKYFKIYPQQYQSPKKFWIEGDATAATYFYTAGLISGPVKIKGLNSNSIQGDIHYLDIIKQLGGIIEYDSQSITVKKGNTIKGISIDMNAMPDAAMTLAITGLFSTSSIEIFNVENLRVKESERIRGLCNELRKFGAIVEERKDGLKVYPPEKLKEKPRIETYRDHRMAMAFSLGCYLTEMEIIDPDCVKKTYPDYFLDFFKICRI
ncbi:MAG: 3-phosphoshikimate 1-carboxyvinyltransferase [Leptospiraceae bacterium]|nr:MAG: 3-phosphoshikimate 1-carboxyvinyltransferase [Leptospiraceae bacterium]